MKKIFLAASILLTASTATLAQDNSGRHDAERLTPGIKNQFVEDFPDATNVQYTNGNSLVKVSFTQDKEKISAYYDDGNQLVGTIEKKAFDDLPANAKKKILKDYPGYTIADVIRFDDNEADETEMMQYGRSLNDAENYFVELKTGNKAIVVKVGLSGWVDFVTTMK
jgi:hypothetical protein